MSDHDSVQNLISRLVAGDEQPDEQTLTQLRKQLEHKVLSMKRRGRKSLYVCLAAAVLMLIGFAVIAAAATGQQEVRWLTRSGFGVFLAGAILAVVGCVGLLINRGFGYVWARHEFQETAFLELSANVQRLTERVEALSRESRNP